MKFDFKKHIGQKVAMHCKTEEEAFDFCRVMDEAGFRWKIGARYINRNFYDVYEELTCYVFNEGKYGRMDSALNNGYEVLEWGDLILSILVYTFFSRMFDLMLPPVAKHSIVVA